MDITNLLRLLDEGSDMARILADKNEQLTRRVIELEDALREAHKWKAVDETDRQSPSD